MLHCTHSNGLTPESCCVFTQIFRVGDSPNKEVIFVANSAITMKGVHFEVPVGMHMLFGAPGLTFEKGKVRAASQVAESVNQVHRCYCPLLIAWGRSATIDDSADVTLTTPYLSLIHI